MFSISALVGLLITSPAWFFKFNNSTSSIDFAFKKAFTSSVVSLTIAFNSCVVGGLLFLVWKAAILSPLTVWIAVSICCDVGLYFPRTPCSSNCLYWAFKYTPKLSLILSDTSAGILFCKRLRDILSTDLLKLRTAVSSFCVSPPAAFTLSSILLNFAEFL